ncbi:MAG: hypothetical protein ACR2P7_09060 [bacterium]
MQWILLGVVAVALLFLSGRHPKAALGILAALVLAGAAVVFTTRDDARLARQSLPPGDIKIENAVMARAYGDSYQFNARLANASETTALKETVISITMLDCPPDDAGGDCAVIGQAHERLNVRIPPGQARDVSRNIFFRGATPHGTLRWRYRITETRN